MSQKLLKGDTEIEPYSFCISTPNIVSYNTYYSTHQKSGDRVTETVQFYVVITFTFISGLSKIMM